MKTRVAIVVSVVSACWLALGTTACSVFDAAASEKSESSASAGLSNITSMPCAVGGGSCRAAQECGLGTGSLGSNKYNCGGSRRVCCFATCGAEVENVECCNAAHTFAPRPVCQDGKLACAAGQTKVPIGTCLEAKSSP
jgi:hypothetical protein